MSTKTVPASSRVQILTQDLLDNDAFTLFNDEAGADASIYASEDDEGAGLPFRAGDEIPVPEESGFLSSPGADGLWLETDSDNSTDITVLKGVALDRNVRRNVEVTANVTTDRYPNGDAFDASTFPIDISPSETIYELQLSIVGAEVEVELSTTGGDTVPIPVAQPAVLNGHSCDSVQIKDPNNNTPRVAGGWAGE